MPLITQSLPNMIQGISQQPAATRYEGQCEDMLNAYPSIVRGLVKRPSLEFNHLFKESGASIPPLEDDVFIHFITTREKEQYVLVHDGTKLRVYNRETGVLCDISYGGSGSGAYTIPSGSYLDVSYGPINSLRAITVGDTSFLLNREKTVAIDDTRTPSRTEKALVFIRQGDYAKDYRIRITGGVAGLSIGVTAEIAITWRWISLRGFAGWWSLASASVVNGGTGYEADKIKWYPTPSGYKIVTMPTLNFTVSGGVIQSVSIRNPGQIKGDSNSIIPTTNFISTPTLEITGGGGANYYVASHTTPTSNAAGGSTPVPNYEALISPEYILSQLTTNLTAALPAANWAFSNQYQGEEHNLLSIERISAGTIPEFGISVSDEFQGKGIGLLHKKVESISELPSYCENGFVIEVAGSESGSEDNFWVEFRTNNGEDYGIGVWEEVVAPDVPVGMSADTMPLLLKLVNLNTFEIEEMPLSQRVAGDTETNPDPSFVGLELKDIFFFKDRMGFLAGNYVVLSEAGIGPVDNGKLFYNFYRSTVMTLLDSDRIDISVSSTKTVDLEIALPIQDRLLLFANGQQFVFRGGDILTGETAEAIPTTAYELNKDFRPVPIGETIALAFKRGIYSGLREYVVDIDTDGYTAPEITEQVPRFLPRNLNIGDASTTERVLAVTSKDTPNELFINVSHVSNNAKVLNSWGRHSFPFTVRGLNFDESILYMVGDYETEEELFSELTSFSAAAIAVDTPFIYQIDLTFNTSFHLISVGDYIQLKHHGFTVTESSGGTYNFRIKEDNTSFEGSRHRITAVYGDTVRFEVNKDNVELYPLVPYQSMPTASEFTFTKVKRYPAQVSMNFQSDSEEVVGFTSHLDMKVRIPVTEGQNVISMPFDLGLRTDFADKLEFLDIHAGSVRANVLDAAANTILLNTPYPDDSELLIGFKYPFKYRFSEYVFKSRQGQTTTPTQGLIASVLRGSLYFTESGEFEVEVSPPTKQQSEFYVPLRPTKSFSFVPDVTRSIGAKYFGPTTVLETGAFKFPVRTRPENAVIEIKSSSYTPLAIQSAEFESNVNARSNRFGG